MRAHSYRRQFDRIDWDGLTARIHRFGDFDRAMDSATRNIVCRHCGLWKRAKVHR